MERKFIDLKSLKVSDEGPGTIEGYRSVFGEIDEGGDIVIKGAFAECTAEYLSSGFTAESHDWDFGKSVGFPIEAKEDDHGWFVKSQFHSTPDAQNIRTKARERMEAGKQVGFSFGYTIKDFSVIEEKDYGEHLKPFVKAESLDANLEKAKKFKSIRILKKVSAIEDSLVTAPMNKLAAATAVKSEQKEETGTEPLSVERGIAAIEDFTRSMQRNHDNRVKEGRVLSGSNRSKVIAARDALNELLAASEPPPPKASIDLIALRLNSERMRAKSLRLISGIEETKDGL
jgi:HK97 family phage prohead protease